MKRLAFFSLIGLAALALSACGTPTNVSWPGLAADANNAYLANGNLVYAVRLSDGLKLWAYPEKSAGQVFHSNPVIKIIADAACEAGLPGDAIVEMENDQQVVDFLRPHLGPQDVVLVKGSRGMYMDRIVAA